MLWRFLVSLFCISLFLLIACQKDKPLNNNNPNIIDDPECYNFPEFSVSSFRETRYQFKAPCFNPNNPKEFVYCFKDYELGLSQLVKYNLETKQKTILVNSVFIYGQPKWNKNGWIAFNTHTSFVEHINIVKDNADSLTQVTIALANFDPIWNNLNNDLYWTHNPDLGANNYLIRRNAVTYNIDTIGINVFAGHFDVWNDKILTRKNVGETVFYGFYSLNELPITVDKFKVFGKIDGSLLGLTSHPSGNSLYGSHFYTENSGLFEIRLSGVYRKLLNYCSSKRYEIISCSADGKYLIAERIDSSLQLNEDNEPTGRALKSSTIWLINTETLEETKVEIS